MCCSVGRCRRRHETPKQPYPTPRPRLPGLLCVHELHAIVNHRGPVYFPGGVRRPLCRKVPAFPARKCRPIPRIAWRSAMVGGSVKSPTRRPAGGASGIGSEVAGQRLAAQRQRGPGHRRTDPLADPPGARRGGAPPIPRSWPSVGVGRVVRLSAAVRPAGPRRGHPPRRGGCAGAAGGGGDPARAVRPTSAFTAAGEASTGPVASHRNRVVPIAGPSTSRPFRSAHRRSVNACASRSNVSRRASSRACATRSTTVTGPGRITRAEIRYSHASRNSSSGAYRAISARFSADATAPPKGKSAVLGERCGQHPRQKDLPCQEVAYFSAFAANSVELGGPHSKPRPTINFMAS